LSKKKDVSDRWAYNHIKSYASFAYFPSALLVGVLMSTCLIEQIPNKCAKLGYTEWMLNSNPLLPCQKSKSFLLIHLFLHSWSIVHQFFCRNMDYGKEFDKSMWAPC
jgi:hypothetical protein